MQSSRQSQSGGAAKGSSPAYSQSEILRNRIIAIVVLVVFVLIVIRLVSCAAGALGGGAETEGQDGSATQDAGAASIVQQVVSACEDGRYPAAGSTTGVEDPWVKSGLFTTGNAEIDEWVKEFCDAHSTSDDPSENAHEAYLALLGEFGYGERKNNRHPDYPTWDYDYTLQMFEEGSGNCYNDAAITQWVLRYFGYEDATAQIIFVLLQSGNWSDHATVFVTDVYHDNKQCVVDDALLQEGWMLDADTYVYEIIDIGREFTPDFFEKYAEDIVEPPSFWYDPSVYGDTEDGESEVD